MVLAIAPAQAQTFSVIHTFSGGGDGYQPYAGLTVDAGGHLYGTTTEYTGGTVFVMKPTNGNWVLNTVLRFDVSDGLIPYSKVVFGPGGSMFGTTLEGGSNFNCEFGCGTVYNIRPPQSVCTAVSCPWSGRAIFSFTRDLEGGDPYSVDPVFDQSGNQYGTTALGGTVGVGVVYKLTHSGGSWTETVLHDFTLSGSDGGFPGSGVILDQEGNLYGTTAYGGDFGYGTVYRVSPSGSNWITTTLYSFHGADDGTYPNAALTFDQAGNLYGATAAGGSGGGGTAFKLSPSGGGWSFSLIYSLVGQISGVDFPGPYNALAIDSTGSLYGAAYLDGASGKGSIFKLTPAGDNWSCTSLHDFTGGSDGANPRGGVTLDGNGNLYGTTIYGGSLQGDNCQGIGCGVVWKIAP